MEKKEFLKTARKQMNRIGLVVLVYIAIMNILTVAVILWDVAAYLTGVLIRGQAMDVEALTEHIMASVTSNGWGYILSIAVGALLILFWKGKAFWKEELFAKEKAMQAGTFFTLLAVFLSAQLFAQLFSIALEWGLNLLGLSAMAALEAASFTATGFSMFLYATLLGPISEELLFRGVLLRLLKPWGKQTAIVVSALLFGIFHGNIIQIPFAFLVGLVLGYVTVEYSVVWAIVLHIFNNLVMSDLLGRVMELLPEMAGTVMFYGILIAATVATVILLLVKRRQVSAYFRENRCHGLTMRAMITSPMILIFTVLMLVTSLLTITPL